METGNISYNYRNESVKACFYDDIVYNTYKDSVKRIESEKLLRNKAFKIASNARYDGYQRGLASMIYTFLYKITAGNWNGTRSHNHLVRKRTLWPVWLNG